MTGRMAAWFSTLALVATAADRPPPPLLEPSSPWVVEAAKNLCMLNRAYGTADRKVVIGLQPILDYSEMQVIAITPASARQQFGKASLTLAPAGRTAAGTYVSVKLSDGRQLTRVSVPAATLTDVKTATEMTIDAPPLLARAHLVRASAALATLEGCQADLLASWHVDPITLAPGHAPVPLNKKEVLFAGMYGSRAFPRQAGDEGLAGTAVAVLQVDRAGTVTSCDVVASAGILLDKGHCENGRLLHFKPATDAAGKPTNSVYAFGIRYIQPGVRNP